MLDGEWKLVYTTNTPTMALLAANTLPHITIGDIKQAVDTSRNTVKTTISVSLPGSSTADGGDGAAMQVESEVPFDITFIKGALATPRAVDEVAIPQSTVYKGQTVDLEPLREFIGNMQSARETLGVRRRLLFAV